MLGTVSYIRKSFGQKSYDLKNPTLNSLEFFDISSQLQTFALNAHFLVASMPRTTLLQKNLLRPNARPQNRLMKPFKLF